MKVKNITKVVGAMPVSDPFIIGAYHYDKYPKGNGNMGPDPALLADKNIGNDFDREADWRMYYGEKVPGFPHHPHKGFEIVTIVSEGYADHFDSKGSKGRYGEGDVQLMSAGSGVLHGEMFPLVYDEKENPLRLFQIWLNLPAKSKNTEPDYKMLWAETIPEAIVTDQNGNNINVRVILGNYNGIKSQDPLKNSWAADPTHHVGLALIDLQADAEYTLPKISGTLNRSLFFYDGKSTIDVEGYKMQERFFANLNGGEEITIKNGTERAKLLILEGEPIGEPVAARGPFVMNTEQELNDSYAEYRKTQFGGWPWGTSEMDLVNPKNAGRFASYRFGEELDAPNK